MILSEQGKSADAITVFQKLTEDYPDLPEPYNNLAVLHASAGNYDKARMALERAIRTNPTYATAHENLGDVYAKMASQSYDKAMQLLDSNQPAAPKSKLAMVRSLTPTTTAPLAPPPAAPVMVAAAPGPAPVVTAAKPAPVAPAPAPVPAPAVQLAKAEPKPAAKPEPKAEPKPEPKPITKPEVKPIPKPEPKPEPKSIESDAPAVSKAVESWAKAWSAQDMKGYLNAYGSNFQTPKGQNRKAWEADRTARIEGKGHIKVSIESPQITVTGNTATVKFRQKYVSDRLSTSSRKTLVLEKQGKNWLIKQEQSGG